MAEHKTQSILESIKKKLEKFDQKPEKRIANVTNEFDYVAPLKKEQLTVVEAVTNQLEQKPVEADFSAEIATEVKPAPQQPVTEKPVLKYEGELAEEDIEDYEVGFDESEDDAGAYATEEVAATPQQEIKSNSDELSFDEMFKVEAVEQKKDESVKTSQASSGDELNFDEMFKEEAKSSIEPEQKPEEKKEEPKSDAAVGNDELNFDEMFKEGAKSSIEPEQKPEEKKEEPKPTEEHHEEKIEPSNEPEKSEHMPEKNEELNFDELTTKEEVGEEKPKEELDIKPAEEVAVEEVVAEEVATKEDTATKEELIEVEEVEEEQPQQPAQEPTATEKDQHDLELADLERQLQEQQEAEKNNQTTSAAEIVAAMPQSNLHLDLEKELLEAKPVELQQEISSEVQIPKKSGLLSEETVLQTTESVKRLLDAQNVISGIASFSQSPVLGELTAQLLEPKLERWLNENLAHVVENIVREEIKKIIPKS
ncbi:MAG: DUF2497 domain-containing protein [Alphaproteobacteria bacterium]|nr:DUF2497 domain-containing protein [Alphaproteobacteria bacterium]